MRRASSLVGARRTLRPLVRVQVVILLAMAAVVGLASPASADPVGALSQDVADSATQQVAAMVGDWAKEQLRWVYQFIDVGSAPVLNDRNGWFSQNYQMLLAMGVWVLTPLVLIAVIHAIAKGSMQMLVRAVLVYTPIAIIGSVVAVQIVQLLLDMTDDFAAVFMSSINSDTERFFDDLGGFFENLDGVNLIMMTLFGLLMAFVCMCVYIVLVLREASVYIATAFLPIGFAMLVWPSTSRFFRRMVEFLIAMILSKLVMVAAISLALASLAGAMGVGSTAGEAMDVDGGTNVAAAGASGTAGGTADDDDSTLAGTAAVLQAIVMFGLVAFSPAMTMKLIGNVGSMEMASFVGSHMDRPGMVNQLVYASRMQSLYGSIKNIKSAGSPTARASAKTRAGKISKDDYRLGLLGMGKAKTDSVGHETGRSTQITTLELDELKIHDTAMRADLLRMSDNNADLNDRAVAMAAMATARSARDQAIASGSDPRNSNINPVTGNIRVRDASTGAWRDVQNGGIVIQRAAGDNVTTIVDYNQNQTLVADMKNRSTGADIQYQDPKMVADLANRRLQQGARTVTVIAPIGRSMTGTPGTPQGRTGSENKNADALQNAENRINQAQGGNRKVRFVTEFNGDISRNFRPPS